MGNRIADHGSPQYLPGLHRIANRYPPPLRADCRVSIGSPFILTENPAGQS